jgi:hypothetical protein
MPPINSKPQTDRLQVIRGFLRSLTMLLKSVRLYGYEHSRTGSLIRAAWAELAKALESAPALQIGVAGGKLLIDGSPRAANPVEKGFAEMLAGADIASLQFTARVTPEEFERLVRAFASGGSKLENLVAELTRLLGEGGSPGIRFNQVQFIASTGEAAAATPAPEAKTEHQHLLELLEHLTAQLPAVPAAPAAASGAERPAVRASAAEILQLIARLAEAQYSAAGPEAARTAQEALGRFSPAARQALGREISLLEQQAGPEGHGAPLLVSVAEQVALREATERYASGETGLADVRQMLGRMGDEILSLRRVVAQHERTMQRAGLKVEGYAEHLDRQFWAALPEEKRRAAVCSPDVWQLSVPVLGEYFEQLRAAGETQLLADALRNFIAGLAQHDAKARRNVSAGLDEFLRLYAALPGEAFEAALDSISAQLAAETDPHLESHLAGVFVKWTQLAANEKRYPALQRVLVGLEVLVHAKPELAAALMPRIGLDARVPEILQQALEQKSFSPSQIEIVKSMPRAAALFLAGQFSQSNSRELNERIVRLAEAIGPDISHELREALRAGTDAEALSTIGLLTRLEVGAVCEYLQARLPRWNHFYQNLVVRQAASSGAPRRGQLLVRLLDLLDPLVLPPAIDEIGASGDVSAAPRLIRMAQGEIPSGASPYLIIKAIEALGRLGAGDAAPALRKIAEDRKLWIWTYPRELRIVALQALERIDPDWARAFLPASGISPAELALAPQLPSPDLPGVRQRCYQRIVLRKELMARVQAGREGLDIRLRDLSLGGGMGAAESKLPPGTRAELTLGSQANPIKAQVLLRGSRKGQVSFEIVDIGFEERGRLRKLLLDLQKQSS